MNSTSQKTVAFITPRYVEASAGGAEVACRFFAEKLTLIKGIPAEILTTCAEDHYSWKNFHQPGEFKKNDVTVRRFPADDRKNPDMYGAAAVKLEAKKKLSLEEEDFIFNNNINSQALYEFIRRHQKDYAFFIFTPYLFGTTVNGTKICPEKTLIRPCFHNEPYARTLRVKEMFRRVRGILCNSPPERDLVLKMTGISPEKTFLVGEAVETACLPSEEDILSRFSIRSPYLFYCGRREPGKNFPLLLEMFREYKKQNRNPLQLVTAGSRYVEILPHEKNFIIDAGFVPENVKARLYKNALLTCQPSTKESFSIAVMESWLQKRPVIVNARSEVTDYWVKLSRGGFSFRNFFELEEILNFSLSNKNILDKMGKDGYEFTCKNFTWEKIIDRFYEALVYFGMNQQ